MKLKILSNWKDSMITFVSYAFESLGLFYQQMCGLVVGKEEIVTIVTVIQSSVVLMLLYL